MKKLILAGLCVAASVAFAQTALIVNALNRLPPGPIAVAPTFPVQMIATVEARHEGNVPELKREDFLARQGQERLQVTDAVPMSGGNQSLELFLLIDDGASWTLSSQLTDLRRFIAEQGATTTIGVAYIHNGYADCVQNLTEDHSRAAQAIRLPLGLPSSPYLALSDLIRRWPPSPARREVVLVSSGADPLGGDGMTNPYLDAAIEDAQRAGIVVYAIYTPGTGHSAHSIWRMNWGQNYLAKLADETGGESYMLGFGAPVNIMPYLTDINEHLAHQYRVTILARIEGRAGFRSVKLTTEVLNAEIVAASKIYVPASADVR